MRRAEISVEPAHFGHMSAHRASRQAGVEISGFPGVEQALAWQGAVS
jgi:hypothetical protein